jgi:hypothetical protein
MPKHHARVIAMMAERGLYCMRRIMYPPNLQPSVSVKDAEKVHLDEVEVREVPSTAVGDSQGRSSGKGVYALVDIVAGQSLTVPLYMYGELVLERDAVLRPRSVILAGVGIKPATNCLARFVN